MTTTTMPRAIVTLPARCLVAGLQLTHDTPDGRPVGPVTILDVEPYGDRLLFTLDGGLRMPFAPDEQVAMVCAPTNHPVWCADPVECERQRDADGSVYHGSSYTGIGVNESDRGRVEHLSVGLSRVDDPDGEQGLTTVHVLAMRSGADLDMSPAAARDLAAALLQAADAAEPEHEMPARDVRVGDEVLTAAGWQTVTAVIHDGGVDVGQVGIYTVREDAPAGRYDWDELVRVRREVTR